MKKYLKINVKRSMGSAVGLDTFPWHFHASSIRGGWRDSGLLILEPFGLLLFIKFLNAIFTIFLTATLFSNLARNAEFKRPGILCCLIRHPARLCNSFDGGG